MNAFAAERAMMQLLTWCEVSNQWKLGQDVHSNHMDSKVWKKKCLLTFYILSAFNLGVFKVQYILNS